MNEINGSASVDHRNRIRSLPGMDLGGNSGKRFPGAVLFGWNGWGISGEVWAVIMTAVATVLGFLMLWREKSIAYALVLIWAFVGIALKHGALVGLAAWIGSVLLTGAAVYTLLVGNKNLSKG